MYWQRNLGLTLVEVMVVLAIASILLTLAVPSFGGLIAKRRIEANTSNLVRALMLARSETAKTQARLAFVVRTISNNNNWNLGWCVTSATQCDTNAATIKRFDAITTSGVSITAVPATTSVMYRYNGTLAPGNATAFRVDSTSTALSAVEANRRCIRLGATGHAQVSRIASADPCL